MSNDSTFTSNLTLSSSGVTAGTYGNGTAIPAFSVGTNGIITSMNNMPLAIGTSGHQMPLLNTANTWSAKQTLSVAPVFSNQTQSQVALGVRQRLTTNLDLYVSPSGSDSNDGLSGTTAFQTLTKACDVVTSLIDPNFKNITVHIAAGTYTAGINILSEVLGMDQTAGGIQFIGAGSSTVIAVNDGGVPVYALFGGRLTISNMTLTTGTTIFSHCIFADWGGEIHIGNGITFGTTLGDHITSGRGGVIYCANSNYTISGGARNHITCFQSGLMFINGNTVTIVGTPTLAQAFITASDLSYISIASNTYSGSLNGQKYHSYNNAIIAGGASSSPGGVLPGSTAGFAANGGLYI